MRCVSAACKDTVVSTRSFESRMNKPLSITLIGGLSGNLGCMDGLLLCVNDCSRCSQKVVRQRSGHYGCQCMFTVQGPLISKPKSDGNTVTAYDCFGGSHDCCGWRSLRELGRLSSGKAMAPSGLGIFGWLISPGIGKAWQVLMLVVPVCLSLSLGSLFLGKSHWHAKHKLVTYAGSPIGPSKAGRFRNSMRNPLDLAGICMDEWGLCLRSGTARLIIPSRALGLPVTYFSTKSACCCQDSLLQRLAIGPMSLLKLPLLAEAFELTLLWWPKPSGFHLLTQAASRFCICVERTGEFFVWLEHIGRCGFEVCDQNSIFVPFLGENMYGIVIIQFFRSFSTKNMMWFILIKLFCHHGGSIILFQFASSLSNDNLLEKKPAPNIRTAAVTLGMASFPSTPDPLSMITLFLSFAERLGPLSVMYAWRSSSVMLLLINSCHSTSALAR